MQIGGPKNEAVSKCLSGRYRPNHLDYARHTNKRVRLREHSVWQMSNHRRGRQPATTLMTPPDSRAWTRALCLGIFPTCFFALLRWPADALPAGNILWQPVMYIEYVILYMFVPKGQLRVQLLLPCSSISPDLFSLTQQAQAHL